jgi:hypothetical protein
MQQDYREPFQQQDAQKMQQYQMMMQQQSKYPQDFQDSFHQSEFSIFH